MCIFYKCCIAIVIFYIKIFTGPRPFRRIDQLAGSGVRFRESPHGNVHGTSYSLLEIQASENARTFGTVLVASQHT